MMSLSKAINRDFIDFWLRREGEERPTKMTPIRCGQLSKVKIQQINNHAMQRLIKL